MCFESVVSNIPECINKLLNQEVKTANVQVLLFDT